MSDVQKLLLLLGALATGGLLYLLAPVLTPFLVAAILAYMGDPLVDRLEQKLPRGLAVSIVFLLIFSFLTLLVLLLLPGIERQVSQLIAKLPLYMDRIEQNLLPWLKQRMGEFAVIDMEAIRAWVRTSWSEAGGIAAGALAQISRSGMVLVAALANLLLIPVLTFYLLRDWDILVARVGELFPRRIEPTIRTLATESDDVLGAFLRGQLAVMFGLGTIYSTGLWLVGVDFSLLIGMLAGLVSFVPYLGFVVGMAVASIAALLQFQEVMPLLWVLAVFGVGQLVESFVLTPMLVGDRIGLHPVAVIFAVLAGGQLFGFFGILLALPVAAVVMVLLRHAHQRYVGSQLYGGG